MSLFSMLLLFTFQVGLLIYVGLPLLTPKVLSLPFDSPDNAFLSWAHSLATFHNQSNYWVLAQMVKKPPAMWDTWVQSLGWEDPLEEGVATHSSILAWRIPWTEEPGGLQSMGLQRVQHD